MAESDEVVWAKSREEIWWYVHPPAGRTCDVMLYFGPEVPGDEHLGLHRVLFCCCLLNLNPKP